MKGNVEYPVLEINSKKIYDNAKYVIDLCNSKGINVIGVVKGFNAIPEIVEIFMKAGCKYIGTSRIYQVISMIKSGINCNFMLLRIPMFSEIEDLVKYVDISLNSEIETLDRIEKECIKLNKKHKVILMFDLGDLREGFFDEEELINTAVYVEKNLNNVILAGIGTNVGCYGAIAPTEENLGRLVNVSKKIEQKIGRKLDMVSGGATSSLTLLFDDNMVDGVNNLRIGEGILLGRDLEDLWGYDMSDFHKDAFVLKAQVVEVKNKPSYPVGKMCADAFGNKPNFIDRGIRKRALLAVGKGDFGFCDKLIPKLKGIEILGGSSDHLILDIEDCEQDIKVGDILEFEMYYPPMLYLTASKSISKIVV